MCHNIVSLWYHSCQTEKTYIGLYINICCKLTDTCKGHLKYVKENTIINISVQRWKTVKYYCILFIYTLPSKLAKHCNIQVFFACVHVHVRMAHSAFGKAPSPVAFTAWESGYSQLYRFYVEKGYVELEVISYIFVSLLLPKNPTTQSQFWRYGHLKLWLEDL